MRKIVKFKEGEVVPDNAIHLKSVQEKDKSRSYKIKSEHQGLFVTRVITETVHPMSTFHYYEVEE